MPGTAVHILKPLIFKMTLLMGQVLLLALFLDPKKIRRDVRQLTHYFVDTVIYVH